MNLFDVHVWRQPTRFSTEDEKWQVVEGESSEKLSRYGFNNTDVITDTSVYTVTVQQAWKSAKKLLFL